MVNRMIRNSQSSTSKRVRTLVASAIAAAALATIPSPATGEAMAELHEITLMPVVLDVATGKVHECDVEEALGPDGLLVCGMYRPLVLTHTHELTPPLANTRSHPTGTDGWSEDTLQGDGSRYKTCGYWHAERHGLYPACDNIWSSAKSIYHVVMYRCLQSECTSDHWSTGIIHSDVLQPNSFEWWKNFNNGVERTGCQGTYGSASTVSYHQASMAKDTSPTSCGTGYPDGLMGGGVRYWP